MQPQIENQARMYVYDLMNEAKEHGFKTDDKWNLMLVNEEDRTRIQKDYYPVVFNKIPPDVLLQVFQSVKSALKQSLSKEEMEMDTKSILNGELRHIVAFNPKRQR